MRAQRHAYALALALVAILCARPAFAEDDPRVLVESAVNDLLQEFTAKREQLADDKVQLFEMVDAIASPLFDMPRIAKLVLAQEWKKADADARAAFAEEFKRLLIGTYATALFQYTGEEKINFLDTVIREKKGRKFAKVNSEVVLGEGASVPVNYSLLLSDDKWKIYNLNIAGLNMVTSYRETYAASIRAQGLDGLIESMRETNQKNYAN